LGDRKGIRPIKKPVPLISEGGGSKLRGSNSPRFISRIIVEMELAMALSDSLLNVASTSSRVIIIDL